MPEDGSVVSLEYDPFFVEFGDRYRSKSLLGSKIKTMTGPAMDSLVTLAGEIKAGTRMPFEAAVIDADKSNMQAYFDFLLENGMVTERPLICVDSTPFKGQIPARYMRFGMADKIAPPDSGEQQIRDFAAHIKERADFVAHEFCGMIVLQRPRA
jgi:predicted O-methyltransferase YrrM